MTTPEDVVSAFESELAGAPPPDDETGDASAFQEINERRARVENAELLHHLRGL